MHLKSVLHDNVVNRFPMFNKALSKFGLVGKKKVTLINGFELKEQIN